LIIVTRATNRTRVYKNVHREHAEVRKVIRVPDVVELILLGLETYINTLLHCNGLDSLHNLHNIFVLKDMFFTNFLRIMLN